MEREGFELYLQRSAESMNHVEPWRGAEKRRMWGQRGRRTVEAGVTKARRGRGSGESVMKISRDMSKKTRKRSSGDMRARVSGFVETRPAVDDVIAPHAEDEGEEGREENIP